MTRILTRSKMLSHSAMGLALAFGTAAATAAIPSVALAQDGGEMSRDFQREIVKAQEAMQAAQAAPNFAALDEAGKGQAMQPAIAALRASEAKIRSAKDRQVYGQFSYNIGRQIGDEAMETKGLKFMLDSGLTEPAQAIAIAGSLGQSAYNNGNYGEARAYFQQAIDLGSTDQQVSALIAESYFEEGNFEQGYATLDAAIDSARTAGATPEKLLYSRGMAIAFENDAGPQAMNYSLQLVRDYPDTAAYGDAIMIVRQFGNLDTGAMLDVLRLMNRTGSYKQPFDIAEHVEAANPALLPGEAVAAIDKGIEAGVLDGNDPQTVSWRAEVAQRIADDRSSLSGQADEVRADGDAKFASGVGDAFLGYGMAAEAEEMYRIALDRPGVNTEAVMTRLGIALVDQGKYAEAQEVFAQIAGARKAVADLWSVYAANNAQ